MIFFQINMLNIDILFIKQDEKFHIKTIYEICNFSGNNVKAILFILHNSVRTGLILISINVHFTKYYTVSKIFLKHILLYKLPFYPFS